MNRIQIPPDSPCPCGSGKQIADCCVPSATGLAAAMKLLGGIILAVHILGILIATVAAWYEIRTIIVSGMILAPPSLGIAFISFRGCRPLGFYCGLAVPTAAIICFFLICGFNWGPSDAQTPVELLLALFSLICVPVGIAAVVELCRSRRLRQQLPAQFGISSLLWMMLVVSLFFSCLRANSQRGMAIVALAGYGIFLWRVVRDFRSKQAAKIE